MKLKDCIFICVIAILALLLLYSSCNKKSSPEAKQIVITKIDTLVGDTIYVPVPYATKVLPNTKIYQPIPVESINGVADDYCIDAEDCPPIATSLYRDTLHFDSLGFVVVKDSIEGKILERRLQFNLNKYTTTVTNNLYEKKKLKAFFGIEAIGNEKQVVSYLGANLSLQFKNDNTIQAGAGYWGNLLYYKAGILFKIKLSR